jgi:hypothetical protein
LRISPVTPLNRKYLVGKTVLDVAGGSALAPRPGQRWQHGDLNIDLRWAGKSAERSEPDLGICFRLDGSLKLIADYYQTCVDAISQRAHAFSSDYEGSSTLAEGCRTCRSPGGSFDLTLESYFFRLPD